MVQKDQWGQAAVSQDQKGGGWDCLLISLLSNVGELKVNQTGILCRSYGHSTKGEHRS